MAEIFQMDGPKRQFAMDYAVRLIQAGKVVAFPTDTFYGLGADPFNLSAINEIFRIKRRSSDRALPLLVSSLDQAVDLASDPPRLFFTLAEKFWPGPLTLVVRASQEVPLKVTANTGRVGLRWPRAPIVIELIEAAKRPLTGTSANLSEHPACSTAMEVERQVGDTVPLILDGGATRGEVPSTVVDLDADRVRILRPGGIPESAIKELLP